ncbi:Syntaxin-2, partial [Orchesella cincta]
MIEKGNISIFTRSDFVVNNIAASVLSTQDYVAKAKTETKKAQEFQQKVR